MALPATRTQRPRVIDSFGVPPALSRVLADAGITKPTPIQAATLPDSLAGRDVLGRGRTGSGKTYAFVLPVLARLAASKRRPSRGRPRALILAPTRELASQIETAMAPLAAALSLRTLTIFGGSDQPTDPCPARGRGHPGGLPRPPRGPPPRGHASLDAVEVTVIDEADHMAELGFLPAVTRLLGAHPATEPATAVLGHAGRGHRWAGPALPQQAPSRTASTRRARRLGHGAPCAARAPR
jgi:superfamily II DNA/RNA helicase